MILQHLPKDEKWQLMDEKWNFNRFAQAPLVDPWYISRAKLINNLLTVEKNKKGELVITCAKASRWKLLLKAVDDKNQDLMNLKYRVSNHGKTIRFTLKKYDGKSAIRLDARRTGIDNIEFKAPGLAYFTHIGLDE